MKVRIDFEPVGRRGECPSGESLLECARHLGVDLVSICGGVGTCGRCIVQVVDGEVSEPTPAEGEYLDPKELSEGYRLACQVIPRGTCKVRVPPESLTAPQRTQIEGEEISVIPEPPVDAYLLQLPAPSLEDLHADAERLTEALVEQHGVTASSVDLGVLRQLSPRLRREDWRVRTMVRDGEVVAVLPPEARSLGLAMDLGTTKIAVYLVDLDSGETLASEGLMNPQIAYGEDVISRMAAAVRDPAKAVQLQTLVIDAVNEAVAQMCGEINAEPAEIVEMVVVGNTAMHHLLVQIPVQQLVAAPYVPAIASALDVKARELGLNIAVGAWVHLLPNIAGYVGSDHVAMLLATELAQAEGVVLALDIGTNTEVCLASHGRLTSLSCASGPAFEGAHIKHGMRAANGAIEHLRLVDDRIEIQTIGGGPAVGLCGSGILDTLAQLLQAGVVDPRGSLVQHPRVRSDSGIREFVLVEGDDHHRAITFTQKDIRELQLAKGAMRTGIEVLLKSHGLGADEIDQVIIAGAFGTYINVSSAIAVGMLPRLPLDRFRQVGNAAGMGARLALISRSKRAEAQDLARRVRYIELASDPGFNHTFAQAMRLESRP
ncbi:MAG: ASKHA domain-containing protein [Anaerolineae bacterium]|nr:ASKHA domain-containing protein [Anaerolineae bacterium]